MTSELSKPEGSDHSSGERRRDARFQVPDAVTIIDPESLPGRTDSERESCVMLLPEVVDESASGICLAFDEPIPLSEGDVLNLAHDGQSRSAVVCRTQLSSAGRFLVGFRWLE